MRKWYGSLFNRLEENQMFCKEIKEGTKATIYFYSDCHPYEVIKVINSKNLIIRELSHEAIGEPMSNDWKLTSNEDNHEIKITYRYKHWYQVFEYKDKIKKYSKINISFGKAKYYYDYEF